MVALERRRQQLGRDEAGEEFSRQHDAAAHAKGELLWAGIAYASVEADMAVRERVDGRPRSSRMPPPTPDWSWDLAWWKPSTDPIRNLVKAGALIAAEIDRLLADD